MQSEKKACQVKSRKFLLAINLCIFHNFGEILPPVIIQHIGSR